MELVQPHSLCNPEEVTELPPVSETCAADRVHEHPLADGLVYHFLCCGTFIMHLSPEYDHVLIEAFSDADWSCKCTSSGCYYISGPRQLSIFNQAVHRRQFHCRARRMNDMQQFQQPLILYTSCTWAAFKR